MSTHRIHLIQQSSLQILERFLYKLRMPFQQTFKNPTYTSVVALKTNQEALHIYLKVPKL